MGQILLLGPDKERAAGVRSLLRQDGHNVVWLRSIEGWRERERDVNPGLVVAAVGSACEVLPPKTRSISRFRAPLLFVQQEADFPREPYLDERLVDRLTSPFLGEELLSRVDALIRVCQIIRREPRDASAAGRRDGIAARLTCWLRSRLPREEKPQGPYLEVAARVAEWADRRDAFAPGHAQRVASFSAMIAEGLGFDNEETAALLRAAMLHDIGKVALPVDVLHQKRPLEETQMRLIRTHPARGAALLRALDPDEDVARVVLYHHERPDGKGYYSKECAGVPRAAFVLAVAEAYDAMTSSRLREPLSSDDALAKLDECKGESYDADCVEALADSLKGRAACIPLSF